MDVLLRHINRSYSLWLVWSPWRSHLLLLNSEHKTCIWREELRTDLQRFQMMIRVPVDSADQLVLMALTSSSTSFSVLKGEYSRMSSRLDLCSSLTTSEAKVKDNLPWKTRVCFSKTCQTTLTSVRPTWNTCNKQTTTERTCITQICLIQTLWVSIRFLYYFPGCFL